MPCRAAVIVGCTLAVPLTGARSQTSSPFVFSVMDDRYQTYSERDTCVVINKKKPAAEATANSCNAMIMQCYITVSLFHLRWQMEGRSHDKEGPIHDEIWLITAATAAVAVLT
eukprot:scaffold8532_cov65-Attheya_sp.AAC.6